MSKPSGSGFSDPFMSKRAHPIPRVSPLERAITNIRDHHRRLERDAKQAYDAATQQRVRADFLSTEASRLDDIIRVYDMEKAAEDRSVAEAAAKSATNTAPAPTQETKDPSEAIAAEAKEVWDAAWEQAQFYWAGPLSIKDTTAPRDIRFNEYLKAQGDA